MISITGASGGIGGALLEALLERFPTAEIAASYNHGDIGIKHPRVSWQSLDLRDEQQIETWSNAFNRIDWLLNCAGFLQGDIGTPEKSIRADDVNFLFENMRVNALPTPPRAANSGPGTALTSPGKTLLGDKYEIYSTLVMRHLAANK